MTQRSLPPTSEWNHLSVFQFNTMLFRCLTTGMFWGIKANVSFCIFAAATLKELDLRSLQVEQWRRLLKIRAARSFVFNVLLAQSTNFQHTSLLKCSLKLKLHQLKAYKPPYRRSLMVKAQLLEAVPFSLDKPPCSGCGATLRSKTGGPQLYLPGIKMTVIIRFSIVIPVLAESLPHCAHLPRHR